MGAIRGEILMLIGAVVAIFSAFQSALIVFVYAGGFMFLYGLIRFLRTMSKNKPSAHKHPVAQAHPMNHPNHVRHHQTQNPHSPNHHQVHQSHAQPSQGQMHQQFHPHSIVQKQHTTQPHNATVKRCPNCHSTIPSAYRHCPNCGFGF